MHIICLLAEQADILEETFQESSGKWKKFVIYFLLIAALFTAGVAIGIASRGLEEVSNLNYFVST